ncbi:hypothetical protein BDV59DRAFT_193836 [Aspergillus ambiguus]|uniref:uncharacterized protein n=1 Tax=Aspergillus ambiguus TaxID=176160 RepID=UPI003CCDD204
MSPRRGSRDGTSSGDAAIRKRQQNDAFSSPDGQVIIAFLAIFCLVYFVQMWMVFKRRKDCKAGWVPLVLSIVSMWIESQAKETKQKNGRRPRQWPPLSSLRRLLFRFQYSRLNHYTKTGENLFQRAEHLFHLEKIHIPLLKNNPSPGQEWIKGVLLCACGAGAILVLNLTLAIIAVAIAYTKSSDTDRQFEYAELYRGSCSVTNRWTSGMHLVINILSTALLAASNYSMQCLSAPSREDIDAAHLRRSWLDVGTFSTRNLWAMNAKRKFIWGILFISSVPIHMMYNSAVFSSITTRDYSVIVIPDDLGENEPLTKTKYETDVFHKQVAIDPAEVHADYVHGKFKPHTLSECRKLYSTEYNTKRGTLLLVTGREYFNGSSSLGAWGTLAGDEYLRDSLGYILTEANMTYAGHWNYPDWLFKIPINGTTDNSTWVNFGALYSQNWERDDFPEDDIRHLYEYVFSYNPGESELRDYLSTGSNWKNGPLVKQIAFKINGPSGGNSLAHAMADDYIYPHWTPVDGCLSQDAPEQCQFYFSLPICLAVLACNATKAILLTVGDALSSFLDRPDSTTKGYCLLSRLDMIRGATPWCPDTHLSESTNVIHLKDTMCCLYDQSKGHPEFLPRRGFWCRSVGWGPWTLTLSLFFSCLATSIGLYIAGISWSGSRGMDTSISYIWALEMGKPTGSTIIVSGRDVILLVLLSNAPQLVYSVLYFLCNGLLTSMHLAAEYNDYATQRKPLRVSWPKGQQRWTYYISLPYRYGFPLVVVSIVLHWLLSQSLFLVKINSMDTHGNLTDYGAETACSFSLKAMFLTILLGSLAMAVLIGLGFRRFRSDMPLASSCSAAISAACHPAPKDTEASLKPVKWGEILRRPKEPEDREHGRSDGLSGDNRGVTTEATYAHCSFTSEEVMKPSRNILYC